MPSSSKGQDRRTSFQGKLFAFLLFVSLTLLFYGRALSLGDPVETKKTRPDPDALILRTVRRDLELQARRKVLDYDLCIRHRKLDRTGRTVREWTECLTVHGDRRPDYGTRQDPRSHGKSDKESEPPFSLARMVDHYRYELLGMDRIHGIPCYRIAYYPKKDLPARNREEKVLHHVSGCLWVAQKDGTLMKNQGHLLEPVPVAWLFVTVQELSFTFDTQLLPNGDFGPKEIRYRYWISIPFFDLREEVVRTFSHFRPSPLHLSGGPVREERPPGRP
jgi:hypothetical protein